LSSESIFSGDNPATDLGQTLLGQLTTSTTPLFGTTGGVREAVLGMLGLYSTAVLVLASFVVMYYFVLAIVDTAQTGKPFRRVNVVWAPIRFIMAIGLLMPLPGAGGLNTGQIIVVKLANSGSGLATRAWDRVTQDPAIMKALVAEPGVPTAAPLVRALAIRDACRQITTQYAAIEQRERDKMEKEGITLPPPTLRPVTAIEPMANGDGSLTTAYGWPERPFFCGSVTVFPPVAGEAEGFRFIKEAHLRALRALEKETDNLARQMQQVLAGDPASTGLSGTSRMAQEYEGEVRDSLRKMLASRLDALLKPEGFADGHYGWVGAGAALDQALRLNVRLIGLASSFPQVDVPDIFLSPPLSANLPDWKVYATLRQVENLWGRVPAISPFSIVGLGGISTVLGQAIATSQSYGPSHKIGQQLRQARDLLRLDDQDWKRMSSRPPLAALAEFGAYLSGKSVALLAGAGILDATGDIAGPMVSIITILGGLGFGVSLMLLLLVPLVPFVRFVLGLATWLLELFEAMVAAPLVALMHLKADEDGLAGRSAVLCYILVMQVALRPILMIFGLLGGLVVFLIMLSVLNQLFATILNGLSNAGQIGSLWFVAASLVYAVLALIMANSCFKLIDWLPQRTLVWLSGWAQNAVPAKRIEG